MAPSKITGDTSSSVMRFGLRLRVAGCLSKGQGGTEPLCRVELDHESSGYHCECKGMTTIV